MKNEELQRENEELRRKLGEAEDTLAAIRGGQVDAIVVDGAAGTQVFSLTGAETVYRLAIETMAEAAINVAPDGTILFCNARFGEFVATPQEQLVGHDVSEFVAEEDRARFHGLLEQSIRTPAKGRFVLCGHGQARMPVRLSAYALSQLGNNSICLLALDLTELESSAQQIEQLRLAQAELKEARRSALNIMEDTLAAERALRNVQERMEAHLSNSPLAIIEVDSSFRVVRWSGDAERIFGWKAAEIVGKDMAGMRWVYEEDVPSVAQVSEDMREGRRPRNLTVNRNYRKDGSVIHCEWYNSAIYDEAGRLTSVLSQVLDITERKRAEEALNRAHAELEQRVVERTRELSNARDSLRTERQRLYDVLETLPVYVILLSRDHRVAFANRFFRERFGEDRGRKCYDFLFERTEPCENCETFKVMESRAPHHWEWTGPDGRYYDIFDFPFSDTDGSLLILEMGIDITERKQAERMLQELNQTLEQRVARRTESLRESEERYRLLVEQAVDGIFLADAEGRYIDVNTAGARMLGYTREEVCRLTVTDVIVPADVARMPGQMSALASGAVTTNEWEFRRKDGSTFPGEVVGRQLSDGRLLGILRDITERKKAEEALKTAHAELERRAFELEAVNRELEAFSYTVSHDLKAPLRSIDGFARALFEDYPDRLDATGRDYLARVHAATLRMNQLIDAMLDMARLTRGELHERSVDLSAIAQVAASTLRRQDPHRRADCIIAEKVKAKGDTAMLEIVLQNLFDNAWKFTAKHEAARIEFGVMDMDGRRVHFVRDDGAGFDMKFADKLFQPFIRMHAESEFPGLGIGLAIAHRIILRHGGRMWAEAAVGKGATFFFTLA